MQENAIDIIGFSFSIGRKPILKNVSLSISRGEVVSIIGPNGAGKTTLLRCIDRIHTGGQGSIRVAGRDLAEYDQKQLARQIGYVPQVDATQFPFTVHEFVLMGRYPHLSPFSSIKPEDERAVEDAMETTGIGTFRDRLINTLSSGERQKVFIAAALAQQAEILLLDEPTTFLDYRHQLEVLRLLSRINADSGITVLSVTHDINTAALSSTRIVAIKNGGIAFDGPPSELMKNDVLRGIYDKPFLFAEHPQTRMPVVVPEEPGS